MPSLSITDSQERSIPATAPSFASITPFDAFNIISVLGAVIGASACVNSTNLLPFGLCIGYLGLRVLDSENIKESVIKVALRQILGEKLCRAVTPGPNEDYYNHHREEALAMLPAEASTVTIPSSDNTSLDAIWIPVPDAKEAMVIFPGNTVTAGAMLPWGVYYAERGYSVLLTTMRGYKGKDGVGSDGDLLGMDGETTLMKDADSLVDFVIEQGFEEASISAHGYSTGGFFAAYTAHKHPEMPKIVLDRAFTSFAVAASHKLNGYLSPDTLEKVYPSPPQEGATRFNTLAMVNTAPQKEKRFFIMQAANDHHIPLSMGTQLAKAAHTTAHIFEGGHAIEYAFDDSLQGFPTYDPACAGVCLLSLFPELERSMTAFLTEDAE